MCFVEFLGYTCGHTSLPVLRACPLTTASHTYPTCTRRAEKPFLAGEMCGACQKIIHSRATQIEEYEHRFMHERGVCGCDTVFPYLIRPRIVGAVDDRGIDTGGCDMRDGRGDDNNNEDGLGGQKALPPLLQEARVDGQEAVSVRLPSLYATEWVGDHRARHNFEQCDCQVNFQTYQEAIEAPALRDVSSAVELEDDLDETYEGGHTGPNELDLRRFFGRFDRRAVSMSLSQTGGHDDDKDASNNADLGKARLVRSHSEPQLAYDRTGSTAYETDADAESVADADHTHLSPPRRLSADAPIFSPRHDATEEQKTQQEHTDNMWTGSPSRNRTFRHRGSSERGRSRPGGRAVRFAGAVFAEVPAYLPLTGPFLTQPSPFAAFSGQLPVLDSAWLPVWEQSRNNPGLRRSDRSSRWRRLGQQFRPLVGFPLGAGPEGVSHALPWQSRPPCWRPT